MVCLPSPIHDTDDYPSKRWPVRFRRIIQRAVRSHLVAFENTTHRTVGGGLWVGGCAPSHDLRPHAWRPFPFQLNLFRNLWVKASCVYAIRAEFFSPLALAFAYLEKYLLRMNPAAHIRRDAHRNPGPQKPTFVDWPMGLHFAKSYSTPQSM